MINKIPFSYYQIIAPFKLGYLLVKNIIRSYARCELIFKIALMWAGEGLPTCITCNNISN